VRCEGRRIWRGQIMDRKFRNIDIKSDIMIITRCKNKVK
jgi:hypothetical protein